jgi:tetratricopeptide (TPR) repeat protein
MITRSVVSAIRIVLLLFAIAFFPTASGASATEGAPDSFGGYTKDIRDLAQRVIDLSTPGNHDKLKAETRALGKRMHVHAILSINTIPEKVFLKARKEGWSGEAVESMRLISEVAPLSVPLWAWLFKEDIVHFRIGDAIRDFSGIAGAVRRFGPALLGYGAWLVTYLVALSCWFSVWAAICLFLRGRPSLEADLKRILKVPYRDVLAPVVALLIFVLPVLFGFGLAVAACIWLAVSTVYLRRAEIVIMTVSVVMMACLVLGGGILYSFDQIGGNTRKGGWLGGDGNIPRTMPAEGAPVFSADVAWMLDFARARIDMQAGRSSAAELRFTELLQTGKAGAEVLNNRGIARAQQGKLDGALADFEAARLKNPGDGPAVWNAYQVYLQTFNLDRASAIQSEAWAGVQKLQPYGFRPAEFDQGEWIASGMPVGEIWLALIRSGNETIRDAGKNEVFRLFFHPMSPYGALFFLGMAYVWSMVWKAASQKLWVNCTCRVCGSRAMIIASRETSDICTPCRAQIGGGIRAGEERDRRVLGIALHRRFVRLSAIFVPGAGVLWAGKEIRSFAFGLVFAASLAGVTSSLGIASEGNPIVYSLQKSVLVFFLSTSVLLWIGGAIWGLRSFTSLQRRFNIIGGR